MNAGDDDNHFHYYLLLFFSIFILILQININNILKTSTQEFSS